MTAVLPAPAWAPVRPLFTASVWAWSVALLAVHAGLCICAMPYMLAFDRDRRLGSRLAAWITRTALSQPRSWRGPIGALATIRLDRPTVIVMNHRSLADIAVAVAVPGGPKIVSKPWVRKVPLLGLCMRLCGHVVFDPTSPSSVRALMKRLEGLLARGNSVLVFPEGSRRTSPGLGTFHEGAFRAAVRAGADVLPVVLHGTGEMVPKGSFAFRDAAVDVTPLPRIAPGTDRRALARRVHEAMAASLAARA